MYRPLRRQAEGRESQAWTQAMPLIKGIQESTETMTSWRRDIHAHPELGFQELARPSWSPPSCESFGIEVHRGVGKTGVVGVLRNGSATRSVGLRADMDALPIQEANTFAHRSPHDGPHARLRPRRPHDDAARRGALPRRDAQLRRHRALHLPARRGRHRRRQGDDRRRPVRALPLRRGVRHAQPARACRSGRSRCAPGR